VIRSPSQRLFSAVTARRFPPPWSIDELGARFVVKTALSARMDPEELRELISVYHKCVAEAVRRFGALHPSGLTALVGREEETELLLRRWSRAKDLA
jgi:hypothetical protein